MGIFFYDFHIHSSLSPCACDDMTVNNIAGMAMLGGLDIIALTDHNSAANCFAFYTACQKHGIVPLAGVEVTTAEEVHLVCLFETPECAVSFEETLKTRRLKIKNRPEIFGNQLLLDAADNIIGTEDCLLHTACGFNIEEIYHLTEKNGGACFPAHADKPANGIINILGALPEKPPFACAELTKNVNHDEYVRQNPSLSGKIILKNSDAHSLGEINEAENFIKLPLKRENAAEETFATGLRKLVIAYIKGEDVWKNFRKTS